MTAETLRQRVTKTHGALWGVVKARKPYPCDGHLADEKHFIKAGEQYVASALPPDHPEIGNDRWWHMRLCMDCCPVEFESFRPDGSQ